MKVFNFIIISIAAAFYLPQTLMKRAAKSVSLNGNTDNEIMEESFGYCLLERNFNCIQELRDFSSYVFDARLHELLCR